MVCLSASGAKPGSPPCAGFAQGGVVETLSKVEGAAKRSALKLVLHCSHQTLARSYLDDPVNELRTLAPDNFEFQATTRARGNPIQTLVRAKENAATLASPCRIVANTAAWRCKCGGVLLGPHEGLYRVPPCPCCGLKFKIVRGKRPQFVDRVIEITPRKGLVRAM